MDESERAYESEHNRKKLDDKGWKWIEKDKILFKLIDVNERGWKWLMVDERGWKGLKIFKSQWKLIKVNAIG